MSRAPLLAVLAILSNICVLSAFAREAPDASDAAETDSLVASEPSPHQLLLEMIEDGTLFETRRAEGPASYRVTVEVFKKSAKVGVPYEFMLVTVDGQLEKVYVVSTGKAGNFTWEGERPLSIEVLRGTKSAEKKPYPWHRSRTYNNSSMFWGLQIIGGFWVHSTPHYGELGRPASMGCVRMGYPGAMELYDLVVNRVSGSAMIKIYGTQNKKGPEALAAHGLDAGWLKDQIEKDLADAHAITTKDYNGRGHARVGQELVWPSCGGVDCFDYFGVKKPVAPAAK